MIGDKCIRYMFIRIFIPAVFACFVISCSKNQKNSPNFYQNNYLAIIHASDSIISILKNGFETKDFSAEEKLLATLQPEDAEQFEGLTFLPLKGFHHALNKSDADYYSFKDKLFNNKYSIIIVHESRFINPGQLFIYLKDNTYKNDELNMIGYYMSDGEIALQYTKCIAKNDSLFIYNILRRAIFPDLDKFEIDTTLVLTKKMD